MNNTLFLLISQVNSTYMSIIVYDVQVELALLACHRKINTDEVIYSPQGKIRCYSTNQIKQKKKPRNFLNVRKFNFP